MKFLFTPSVSRTSSSAVAGSFNHWPLPYTFGNATEASLTGNFAYDYNTFSGDDRLKDRSFLRRQELGISIK
ncbi:porin, partial [Xylella fastidiosa subsp. multiplex]|nr:porin [Xylella fastidiosa subsp. multiplex]